jgi:hypothetical protein
VTELANLAATGDPDAETAVKILKQGKSVIKMAINEFPIGQTLLGASTIEDW